MNSLNYKNNYMNQSNRFSLLDNDYNKNVQSKPQVINTRFDVLKENYTKENNDNRYNKKSYHKDNRYPKRQYESRTIVPTIPQFLLTEEKIKNEFPGLNDSNTLTNNECNHLDNSFTDIVKKEKEIVVEVVKQKPNDVRSLVNDYYNNCKAFEERRYDSDGWMENEDWLEWYDYHYKYKEFVY